MCARVNVKLLLLLSDKLGKEELEMESDDIEELQRKIVERFKEQLSDDNLFVNKETGLFHDHMLVLINGRNIKFMNGLKTKLNEGDTVVICPPVAGG
ncbi:MAG: MoaD family protein [Candidatus Helarchaeales archaeon]